MLQVLVFNNRGILPSTVTTNPLAYSSAELAEDVACLLDYLGGAWAFAPVHMVGLSMGGMIALEFAVAYPQRVDSLALLSSHGGQLPTPTAAWSFLKVFAKLDIRRRIPVFLDVLYVALPPIAGPFLTRSCRYHPTRMWPAAATPRQKLHQFHQAMQERNEPPLPSLLCTLLGQLKTVLTHYVKSTELLRLRVGTNVRVLLIAGARDRIIPSHCSASLHSILGGNMVLLSTGSHLLDGERPDDVSRLVLANMFDHSTADVAPSEYSAEAIARRLGDVVDTIEDAHLSVAPVLGGGQTDRTALRRVFSNLCQHRGPCLLHILRPGLALVGLVSWLRLTGLLLRIVRRTPSRSGQAGVVLERGLVAAGVIVGITRAFTCLRAGVRGRMHAVRGAHYMSPLLPLPPRGGTVGLLCWLLFAWRLRRH